MLILSYLVGWKTPARVQTQDKGYVSRTMSRCGHDSDVAARGLLPRALLQLSIPWEPMAEKRPGRSQMHQRRAAACELAAHARQTAGLGRAGRKFLV